MTVFLDDRDYRYYLVLMAKYKADHPFDLYHYCLMPNHTHLLVQTKQATDFVIFMKKLNLAYFHHYRNHYGWRGHFWQDRYKSQPVGKDAYFIQCGKYIELNPVRATLCKKPEDYRYSSYCYYALGQEDQLVTQDLFYQDLGSKDMERQAQYRNLLVSDLIQESYDRKIWGSSSQRYNEQQKLNRGMRKRSKYNPNH